MGGTHSKHNTCYTKAMSGAHSYKLFVGILAHHVSQCALKMFLAQRMVCTSNGKEPMLFTRFQSHVKCPPLSFAGAISFK